MKKVFPILILAFLFGCNNDSTSTSDSKQVKEIKNYTIEALFKNESVNGGSFSADGKKLLVSSNKSGIFNAYEIMVDGSGEKALTNSEKESVFAISYFPNDDRFLFSSDKGGNEISHIYLQNQDGSSRDLTPVEEARAGFAGWARDLNKFYYSSNKRDPKFTDMYEMDINSFKSELIYENKEGLDLSAISNSERYFVLEKSITTNNNEIYLYDRETKKQTHISEHEGDASFSSQYFSLDDKYLFYTTDNNADFTALYSYDIATGKHEKIYETNWDIWYAYQSWNGKYRVIGINQDAKTKVIIQDMKNGGKEIEFPDFGNKSISGVSIARDESKMRMTVASSQSPSNIYVYNFDGKAPIQLTNTLNPEINEDDLVQGKVIRYKSFDGLEIPSIFYKPHQANKDNKVPALVWVHGGPGGQSRLNYSSTIQYLVNHGYAILAVNNRGSSGYGKAFNMMDNQKHGDVDLKDCVNGKSYLQSLDFIDPDKIGIIGGSYGGYMTMAALAFTPDEFEVGVNIFGVTNWLRTLKSTPPWWESFRKALFDELGDPFTEDSVRLHAISPLFHAENIKKPVMVLQGANDPRVLQVESDEMVAAIRANNVEVEYVLFPDEGHGFRKKENQIEGYGKVLEFLDKHLKDKAEHLN